LDARLWYWQRISAIVLAACVIVHLGVIVYAARGGLSAAELLGRTRGNGLFAAFYVAFVVACAVHAPIGLSAIAREWLSWHRRASFALAGAFGTIILALGLRAVYAVTV
jgi:fumarate reductase subunit C